MRYCPACSHTSEDDTARFCPKDATPLVDEQSPSQMSVTMLPGQARQAMAATPVPRSIGSQNVDAELTPSQGIPVSAGVSDQPGTSGNRLVFDLSEPVSAGEKSLPKLEPKSQSKSQPKAKLARKRRLLVLLVLVGAALLIGTAGVFFWWQHYKTTPAYYLALLVDAVHRNDNATVDQIVAMDKITDTFASQVTQNALSQNTSATTDAGRKQLESSLTGLSPKIKQMVREEVEKQVADEAAPSAGKSLLMIALAEPYKVGIKQAGDTATVAPQAHPVEWTMQRSSGGPWTIAAVKDDALASRILGQINKDLPAEEKKQSAAARQKNQPATAAPKDSTDGAQAKKAETARAKKKERKKQQNGIRIDLRPIWPE